MKDTTTAEEISKIARNLSEKCVDISDSLQREFGLPGNQPPISAFNMIHNEIVVNAELLEYYNAAWSQIKVADYTERDRYREDNANRVMMVTKNSFISAMSSMEFCAKKALVARMPLLPIDFSQRIYLGKIVKVSYENGWLTEEEKFCFDDLIFVRNCLIHNNGISEKARCLKNPNGEPVQVEKDQMIQGKLDFFLDYTNLACAVFNEWVRSYLKAADFE